MNGKICFVTGALPRLDVIVVASDAYRRATLDSSNLMNARVSGFMSTYQCSKLANMLFGA
ncbi:MAG TPA: hypothetical protein VGD47_11745 [Steroidobacteraceae bacterium]